MVGQLYEIVVRGVAGPGVRSAFAEFDVSVDDSCTRLRAVLADQAALFGALDRARDLGLEVIELRQVVAN
jgi:hypothetical protein